MNEEKIRIAVIVGTARPARESIKPARLVFELFQQIEGVEAVFVDPLDFNLPNDGNDDEFRDERYTKITQEADAFYIVTPEYNHSYPGSLKRLLDSEYKNYKHKAVAIAGVSNGRWGGVRAIEALIHPLRKMGLVITSVDMQFPSVQELFDTEGKLKDQKYAEYTQKSIKELIWMAKALKAARALESH